MKKAKTRWTKAPDKQHYVAANPYLNLLYPQQLSAGMAADLREAHVTGFKAKDIFWAAYLSPLSIENSHVKQNCFKMLEGRTIAPLLLVRDGERGCVVVADGYYQLCAVYALNEDASIHYKIV